jgi:ParB family chromosome partitioning protein
MVDTVPLNKLILSPLNVRKTHPDISIEELADSIHEKGLLQNLVVAHTMGGKGLYEVGGGGRRWRALQRNVALKRIPRNWDVPVKIVDRAELREASLAENLKEAMNPADEVEAFLAIIGDYEAAGMADPRERVAHCARRFGFTVRYVDQRLRLANLAPPILEALRAGEIVLDSAQAYAGHPDQAVQLKIFEAEKKKTWQAHSATSIRDAIAGKVYTSDHKLVVYIGLDAYLEAGGRLETDLFFMAEERQVLLDPSLVDKLAREKGEREAGKLAQDEGWADGMISLSKQSWQLPAPPEGFRTLYHAAEKLTPEQRDSSIAIFEIGGQGELRRVESCFVKTEPEQKQGNQGQGSTFDRAAWEAEQRREAIEYRAARLAAPSVGGTQLEGRTFWPPEGVEYVSIAEKEEEGDFVVALLVRIPAADVERHFSEAEALYEKEIAEEDAEEDGEGDEGGEGEGGDAVEAEAVAEQPAPEPELQA